MKSYFHTIISERKPEKIKLNGKKFDPIPTYRVNKWMSEDSKNTSYNPVPVSQHTLIFNKKKEDVFKNVLLQLQPKLK